MKVKQVISESRNGRRMEVIGKEGDSQKTLHIHKESRGWNYLVGEDRNGKKVFAPITV